MLYVFTITNKKYSIISNPKHSVYTHAHSKTNLKEFLALLL
jgi:hypothetical protein